MPVTRSTKAASAPSAAAAKKSAGKQAPARTPSGDQAVSKTRSRGGGKQQAKVKEAASEDESDLQHDDHGDDTHEEHATQLMDGAQDSRPYRKARRNALEEAAKKKSQDKDEPKSISDDHFFDEDDMELKDGESFTDALKALQKKQQREKQQQKSKQPASTSLAVKRRLESHQSDSHSQSLPAAESKKLRLDSRNNSSNKPKSAKPKLPHDKLLKTAAVQKGPVKVAVLPGSFVTLRPPTRSVARFAHNHFFGNRVKRVPYLAFKSQKTVAPAAKFAVLS